MTTDNGNATLRKIISFLPDLIIAKKAVQELARKQLSVRKQLSARKQSAAREQPAAREQSAAREQVEESPRA